MQIVDLYEECTLGFYNLCEKSTKLTLILLHIAT